MSKKNSKLSKLFNNKIFLVILSVIISIGIWIGTNYTSNSDTSITISDIPITIELPEQSVSEGLQIFSGNDATASVTVSGNRVTLGTLSKNDIQIVAQQTSSITSTGTYTLSLQAKKSGVKSDYEIGTSISPSVVTIYVDRYKEVDMDITNNLSYKVADDYYGYITLSDDKVTVSGPETEISRIHKIAVVDKFNDSLKKSITKDEDLIMYDSYDDVIQSNLINLSTKTVSTTLTVLPTKEIDFEYSLLNAPSGINMNDYATLSSKSLMIAGPKETLDKTDTLPLSSIDFSTLKNKKYNLDLTYDLPTDCRDIANVSKTKAELDLSKMKRKVLELSKFTNKGLSDEYTSEITTESISITVYGTDAQIKDIENSDIYGVIDFSNSDSNLEGSIEMPVTINIRDHDMCWAYGSYTANVIISK